MGHVLGVFQKTKKSKKKKQQIYIFSFIVLQKREPLYKYMPIVGIDSARNENNAKLIL